MRAAFDLDLNCPCSCLSIFNIRQLVGGSDLRFSIKIFAIWKCQSYLKLNLIKQQALIKMFGMLSILYSLSIAQSSARLFEGLSLSKLVKLQNNLDHVLQDAQDILRKRSDHNHQMKNKGILELHSQAYMRYFAEAVNMFLYFFFDFVYNLS